jgi:hypothetical protein
LNRILRKVIARKEGLVRTLPYVHIFSLRRESNRILRKVIARKSLPDNCEKRVLPISGVNFGVGNIIVVHGHFIIPPESYLQHFSSLCGKMFGVVRFLLRLPGVCRWWRGWRWRGWRWRGCLCYFHHHPRQSQIA